MDKTARIFDFPHGASYDNASACFQDRICSANRRYIILQYTVFVFGVRINGIQYFYGFLIEEIINIGTTLIASRSAIR
jgi:hypothetical protein